MKKPEVLLLGGIVMDRYFMIDRLPGRGEDAFFYDEFNRVGGCMLNTAVTLQNLGADPYMVSCIGTDSIGEKILAYVREKGFHEKFLPIVDGVSGSCLILSEKDGERTFIGRNEAEMIFTEAMQKGVLALKPEVVGVTGFYLTREDAERVVETVEKLHAMGSRILFDPSSLAGDIPSAILRRMIEAADVMTPNKIELEMLMAAYETTEDQESMDEKKADQILNVEVKNPKKEFLNRMMSAGKTIIYKQGGEGGMVYGPDGIWKYESYPCEMVDSNGAGDSFFGGILYGCAMGMDLKKSVDLASRCGAKTCEVLGPHGFWNLDQ